MLSSPHLVLSDASGDDSTIFEWVYDLVQTLDDVRGKHHVVSTAAVKRLGSMVVFPDLYLSHPLRSFGLPVLRQKELKTLCAIAGNRQHAVAHPTVSI